MSLTNQHEKKLQVQASIVREKTAELIVQGGGGHIGGDFSEIDILVNLYDYMNHTSLNPNDEERDYFILSKGHAAEAYYVLLDEYGYISDEILNGFGKFQAVLGGHPTKKVGGIEANTGSLGHGIGIAVGIALALRKGNKKNKVYVLTGDGEMVEGSNWEAIMSASKYKLDNLVLIIDRNNLQISGTTEEVMPLEKLEDKMKAFGFYANTIDGHNMQEIRKALMTTSEIMPTCIIAKTIKGKGLYCAENQVGWHHKTPNSDQLEQMKLDMKKYREELSQ